jgi:hypothetical protein
MTFDAQEQSVYGGSPGEFYAFAMGSTTWYLASGDVPVTISGHPYTPAPITRSKIEHSGEEWSGDLDITLPKTHPIAVLLDGPAPIVPLTLTAFRKHRSDAAVVQFFGPAQAVGINFRGPDARITFAPISRVLKRLVPSLVFQSQCPLALYGTRCGVNVASFSRSATITAVSGATLESDQFALDPQGNAAPNGYYTNGYVELTNGDRRFTVGHVGTALALMYGFPAGSVAVDDQVVVAAGCDRSEATCDSRFDNLDRHLGYCRIPYRNPFEKGTS